MSDGQSHAERLERRHDSGGDLVDETQAWPVPHEWRAVVRRLEAPDHAAAGERERQAQRDHELAMARVENEAALVEARVRLASAWHQDSVAACLGAALAFGAGLGGAFAWAVLR